MRNFSELIRMASMSLQAGIDPAIEVEVKNVYGRDNIYVVSDHKEALQSLTGSKTLTQYHIKALKELGFTFKEKGKSERTF